MSTIFNEQIKPLSSTEVLVKWETGLVPKDQTWVRTEEMIAFLDSVLPPYTSYNYQPRSFRLYQDINREILRLRKAIKDKKGK